jgi:hypothetical protein
VERWLTSSRLFRQRRSRVRSAAGGFRWTRSRRTGRRFGAVVRVVATALERQRVIGVGGTAIGKTPTVVRLIARRIPCQSGRALSVARSSRDAPTGLSARSAAAGGGRGCRRKRGGWQRIVKLPLETTRQFFARNSRRGLDNEPKRALPVAVRPTGREPGRPMRLIG